VHPIRVQLDIVCEDSQLVYYMQIENNSEYMVESVHCPYIADIQHPKGAMWLKGTNRSYLSAGSDATGVETLIWPEFQNQLGYFGFDYPIQVSTSWSCAPMSPFYLIRSEKEGLYVGVSPQLWI